MQWFYAGAPLAPSSSGVVSNRTHRCECFFQRIQRLESSRRFPEMMPDCAPGGQSDACKRQLFGLHTKLLIDERVGHIEVTHLAFNSKHGRKRPHKWSNFLDSSASGWWFTHAPGSGIFYDLGRTLVASFKNTLLIRLVDAYAADAARHAPAGLSEALRHAAGGSIRNLSEALRSHSCQPPLSGCYIGFLAPDDYDELVLWLGRALGYDSLCMAASPLSLEGHFVTECVDLRLPPSPLFDAQRVRPHRGHWTEQQALAWRDEYRRTHRLSLRDPRHLSQVGAPCDIVDGPPLRLACSRHISTQARHEPDCENLCFRRRAAAQYRNK
jgi:hypothetical protein